MLVRYLGNMTNRPLNRREFTGLATASLVSATPLRTSAQDVPKAARTVKLRDGKTVPALGQGSARLARGRRPIAEEEAAVRAGISLGMTVIDTAEIYGSEEFIGRAIAGQRDKVFLVSKVWPNHVAGDGIARACEASLKRLGTDHLDLYLLHWPQKSVGISHVVSAFEDLVAKKKIRAWGVSNFGVREMEELFRAPRGDRCATNQIPYSLDDRAIEHGVLPWCRKRAMPIMAYSPLGGEGAKLLRHETLARIGTQHGCSAATVALAWAIRGGDVIAIPQSGSVAHVKENAVALSLTLTPQDLQALDAAFPPGGR
jgi:diketogulonate reductase-like aldo/keto reductase